MGTQSLPLSNIIPISVVVSPLAAPGLSFNQGLIVGSSPVIPTYPVTANSRLRAYTSVGAMLTDGFTTTDPEYYAATLYFGQTPAPTTLWVGRQNLTAIATITVGSSGGTGYVVGDIITVVQGGASGGQLTVTTIGGSGAITGLAIIAGSQGTGYAIANNLATTGGTGTGGEVDITAIGETALQSVTACRTAQPAWYCCSFVASAVDADYLAIAAFIEAATPQSTFFVTSGEAAILNGTSGNLFATLQSESYRRTFMMYSTTQGGAAPNNAYAACAVMGYAMGADTGAANSYFALAYKTLAGVAFEPLTQTQVNTIAGTNTGSQVGYSGNVYVDYANGSYNLVQFGTMASGVFFDEVLNLDVLSNDMQNSGVALLVSLPSLPLTDGGVTLMKNALAGACIRSQSRGFIAPSGTWTGTTIGTGSLAITSGQSLPQGFALYAPPCSTLSPGQRASRQLPPITVAVIESGSGMSLAVTINVQR